MAIMTNDDPRYKRVMIRGPFGGGKTILLQHKAIQLNEQPEYNGKVMFVVYTFIKSELLEKSMLYYRLKIELEENRGILVKQFNMVSFHKFLKYILGSIDI